ncbi:fumarate reductase [Aliagarivorans taiwanensis]|uniref:fumarate reductase n=1 Tax=Aliagarivorans taiwanensis TaxID=561966 RepID=UPI000411CA8A|nr:fumarate reductase [Aliagarivorans taiwanensis]
MSKRKPYVRKMGSTWWTKNNFHTMYIVRELSSLVILAYSVILLFGLNALRGGEAAFDAWFAGLTNPLAIVFHVITLLWTLYHATTWFSLAPKAANLWIGEKRVADNVITGSLYAVLGGVTVIGLLIAFVL